jgi:hypothetical protein
VNRILALIVVLTSLACTESRAPKSASQGKGQVASERAAPKKSKPKKAAKGAGREVDFAPYFFPANSSVITSSGTSTSFIAEYFIETAPAGNLNVTVETRTIINGQDAQMNTRRMYITKDEGINLFSFKSKFKDEMDENKIVAPNRVRIGSVIGENDVTVTEIGVPLKLKIGTFPDCIRAQAESVSVKTDIYWCKGYGMASRRVKSRSNDAHMVLTALSGLPLPSGAVAASGTNAAVVPSEWQEKHVLIIAGDRDFKKALAKGKTIAPKLKLPFRDRGLKHTAKAGLHWPDDIAEEIGGVRYVARRYNSECGDANKTKQCLTIEDSTAYPDMNKGYFIIVEGVYDKAEGLRRLKAVRKVVKDAYLRKSRVFFGSPA